MPNPHNIEVGQELFWKTTTNRSKFADNDYAVTVLKVGTKWIALDNRERISTVDLIADGAGYSPHGKAYLTEEEFRLEQSKNTQWDKLTSYIRHQYSVPNISLEDINKIVVLLKLNEEN